MNRSNTKALGNPNTALISDWYENKKLISDPESNLILIDIHFKVTCFYVTVRLFTYIHVARNVQRSALATL